MVSIAVALALSFLIVAPLNRRSDEFYEKIRSLLTRFETKGTHPDQLPIETEEQRIAIFGMGRVGTAAYLSLDERYPGEVIGFDRDPKMVESHQEQGRNVLLADATDSDFWARICIEGSLDLAVLAMPKHISNIQAAKSLKRHGFQGVTAATGQFDDEVKELMEAGIDTAFNFYSEAGAGFAQHVDEFFQEQQPEL